MNVAITDHPETTASTSIPTNVPSPEDATLQGTTIQGEDTVEVSVVMPCLNEADTLEVCIGKAQKALLEADAIGEIIVADNGSADESIAIAERMGARVLKVERRGYGSALMAGIASARGRYIIMGDADDSYNFLELPKFIAKLREGYSLVQGCRLPRGGGTVLPGAMPALHRWWGNPMFTRMARRMFQAPINDIYCGMRGFSRELYDRLDQRCTGMEFATEMIVKASLQGEKISEVPITLHPDGRKTHPPHLKTFRDGWRTLRFLLMYSPRWLFLLPGLMLILIGALGYAVAMPGYGLFGLRFDAHTLLFSSLFVLCGYQSILFAIFSKTFAVSEGLLPADARHHWMVDKLNLERGLAWSGVFLLIGTSLLMGAVEIWRSHDFGPLDYGQTMRWVVPGVLLTALGFQSMLSSFFLSILKTRRR